MENVPVYGSIYEKIALARRNFEATLDYYERDYGYESGNEFDADESNTNSKIEVDDGE